MSNTRHTDKVPAMLTGSVINVMIPSVHPGSRRQMKTDETQVRTEGRAMGADQGAAAWTRGPRRRDGAGQPVVRRGRAVPVPCGHPVAGLARALWGFPGSTSAPFALEQDGGVGTRFRGFVARRGQRIPDDRFDHRSSPPAQLGGKRGAPKSQAIGRSRGGLSTKIHTTVDALGNPTSFHLTPGQAHDLEGADVLLKGTPANAVIADKAYDGNRPANTHLS